MDSVGFISYFIFEHLDEDRQRYADYTQEEFIRDFRVDDILFERFVDYSVRNNINIRFYDYEASVKLFIKAALAEQLYGSNIHAKIKGAADAMLMQVLELDNPVVKQSEAELIEATN